MKGIWLALSLCLAACAPQPGSEREFERWLAAAPERAPAFARFEALLRREGVADVLPSRELWLTDHIKAECVAAPFTMPPEELWPHIVPALRYVRDYVEPAVGEVTVASTYRDPNLNDCVGGAPRSMHRAYYALDLYPRDPRVTRQRLIEALCPIHAREGSRRHIGMGIYSARRFHIDARGYRGWGDDFHAGTFPCANAARA